MKKIISSALFSLSVFTFMGCGAGSSASLRDTGSTNVEQVISEQIAANEAAMNNTDPETDVTEEASCNTIVQEKENASENTVTKEPKGQDRDISLSKAEGTEEADVDLTALSGTMVYSEVFSMISEPEKYMGKTVKMSGLYNFLHDETTGNYYFACIIKDATACCAQGIEFVLTDDYIYPDDYPQAGDMITVTGVFDTYTEGENMYCTLRNARLL